MAFAAARMIKEKAKRPSIDFQLNPVSHYFIFIDHIFIDHSLSSLGSRVCNFGPAGRLCRMSFTI